MEHSKRNTPQKPFSVVMKVLKLLGDHISGKQTIFFSVSVHHLETYFSYAIYKALGTCQKNTYSEYF